MSKSRNIAFLALLTSLALIASYIERLLPSPVASVPGIRLGLANTIVLVVLYIKDGRSAFIINMTRIFIAGIMFGGIFGMMYAFSGAVLSFIVMIFAKKTGLFGIIGVSVLGSVVHNIGQILLAAALVWSTTLFYYIPVLIISGTAAGVLTGFVAGICIERLKPLKLF